MYTNIIKCCKNIIKTITYLDLEQNSLLIFKGGWGGGILVGKGVVVMGRVVGANTN